MIRIAPLLCLLAGPAAPQDDEPYEPRIEPASDEGAQAMASFVVPEGFELSLFAAEPLLANPVAFTIDPRGRHLVCETFRLHAGVTDMRSHRGWLHDDLAAKTVEDRLEMMRAHEGEGYAKYGAEHERLRLIEDRDGDGTAETATVFADGFNHPADGIAAGVLVRGNDVYYACIPSLWRLRDADGDGRSDEREVLSTGYGVKISLLGHDLHGLLIGHDGRLYFSIGDRGFHVEHEGNVFAYPDTGGVLRCELDGSGLEVFAYGLRNPQELAFDDLGNLFTGDNNSDGGDRARWVYVVEGGDSGWRTPFQWITQPNLRGPWNAEKMWHPYNDEQPAYIVPPIANLASGPSGLAYANGTGLPAELANSFFLCDFRGDADYSGIWSYRNEPDGAGFRLVDAKQFLWNCLPTDVELGPDGSMYLSDWVHGWGMPSRGRIFRLTHTAAAGQPIVAEVASLLREGMARRPKAELLELLAHADRRVRQEAHLALAARGPAILPDLRRVLADSDERLTRVHALWAIGIVLRHSSLPPLDLVEALADEDAELRAQAARCLADVDHHDPTDDLLPLLEDASARVRYFAALGVGRPGRTDAIDPLLAALRTNGDEDPWLRHGCVVGLERIGDADALLARASDGSRSVRLGLLLALRRHGRPELSRFLRDDDAGVVLEAARAIYDLPVDGAMGALAELAGDVGADSLPLLRRVINANLRVGGFESAAAVAALSRREELPLDARREAVQSLATWSDPPPLDPVTGEWRPFPERTTPYLFGVVRELFGRETLSGAFARREEPLQREMLELWSRTCRDDVAPFLHTLVADGEARSSVRRRALELLADAGDRDLASAVRAALTSSSATLSSKGYELLGRLDGDAALPLYAEVLSGDDAELHRGAYRALGGMEGEGVDQLLATELEALAAGEVPEEARLELVQAAEARSDETVGARLEAWRSSFAEDDPLGPWRVALAGGDAKRGKKVFFENTQTQCLKCHRIGDEGGSEAGPDLLGIGERRGREHVLVSILDPNREIAEGFQNYAVFLKDGSIVAGRIVGESRGEVSIESADGTVTTVLAEEIDERREDLSAMPANVSEQLSREELRDVVEYLSTLK